MGFSFPKPNLHASFLTGWFASAAVTVFLPLLAFTVARLTYVNYDQDGNEQQDENDQGNYGYNSCSWWQFSCKAKYRQYQQQNGENNDSQDEAQTPWWWLWGEEGEGQRREEEGQGTLIFVYIWSLLMFTGIVFYGFQVLRRGLEGSHGAAIMAALIIFGNMSFLSCCYLGGLEGGVRTEGRELEEDGFYGQVAVLLFLTNVCWTIFSFVFVLLMRHKIRHANVTKMEYGDPSDHDYKLQDEQPSVQVTDKETV